MPRPQVQITAVEGTLGGTLSTADGVCLYVHNAPPAYTYTSTPGASVGVTSAVFTSLEGAELAGITEANDLTNTYLLWEHLKDFFTLVPFGEIHVLQLPVATTCQNLFTVGNTACTALQGYLGSKQGRCKALGVGIVGVSETHTTSISADVLAAIPLAQAFSKAEYTRLRPIEVVFEGRKLSGTAAAATDLRALNSGNVSVVVSRNQTRSVALVTAGIASAANYAQIGLFLGSFASVHVGRNVGRLATGTLPVQQAAFSGGQLLYTGFIDGDLNILSDKGYIFMDAYVGRNGFCWVDDHTCTLPNRTDAYIALNRVAHKAARIAVQTYLDRLKDEFKLDKATGRLPAITVQTLQNELRLAIEREMLTNPDPSRAVEISGATVRIDPNQNVAASSKLVARLSIVPLGTTRIIETEILLVGSSS